MVLKSLFSLVVVFQSFGAAAESLQHFNNKIRSESPFSVSVDIIRETDSGSTAIAEISEEEAKCIRLQITQLTEAQKLLNMSDKQIQDVIPFKLLPVKIELKQLAFKGSNNPYFMPKYLVEVVPNGQMTRSTLTLKPSPQTCELVTASAIAEAISFQLSTKASRSYQ